MRIGTAKFVMLILCAGLPLMAQVNKSNLVGVVQDTTGRLYRV